MSRVSACSADSEAVHLACQLPLVVQSYGVSWITVTVLQQSATAAEGETLHVVCVMCRVR